MFGLKENSIEYFILFNILYNILFNILYILCYLCNIYKTKFYV